MLSPKDRFLSLRLFLFMILTLADKIFLKDLWRFETCLLIYDKLCVKLVSSSELQIIFGHSLLQFHLFTVDFDIKL